MNHNTTIVIQHRRRYLAAAVLGICTFAAVSLGDSEQIANTRSALEQWVETRKVISEEKKDWALGRELLKDRIELVRQEIETLHNKIDSAQESIAEADEKRQELIARNDALKSASAALTTMVKTLEERTRTVLRRLPEPIRDRVKPLSQQLPESGEEIKLSASQRFQNIVGILNEVNKFNREISLTSEVRTLADGTSAEVTAMYVGLGHAYYVGANGAVAGIGVATKNGWEWREDNDAAPAIQNAIDIMKNEAVAAFVPLPIEIE